MARVRITKKIPKALSGLEMKMSAGLYGKGTNGNSQFRNNGHLEAGKISQQPTEVRDTLQPVARDGANLEAEKGETAMVNIDGIPAHFKIGGKRHSEGGTPLNLPDNSFIFSDTAKMKIKDPIMLAQFGMVPKKSGYTPAEIAKKYDINKYRQILADPNTDNVDRSTAELMISNYNMKLAKLALVQESSKGFPQGIPVVAMPYVMASGMNPEEMLETGTQGQEEESDEDTGEAKYGGGLMKAQDGLTLNKERKRLEDQERFILGQIKSLRENNVELPVEVADAYNKVHKQLSNMGPDKTVREPLNKDNGVWVNSEGVSFDPTSGEKIDTNELNYFNPAGIGKQFGNIGQYWGNDLWQGNPNDIALPPASGVGTVPTTNALAAKKMLGKLNPYNVPADGVMGAFDYAGNILNLPLSGVNKGLTGKVGTTGNLYTDVLMDPTTYVGLSPISYTAKAVKKYGPVVGKFIVDNGAKAAQFLEKYGIIGGKLIMKYAEKGIDWLVENTPKLLTSETSQNIATSLIGRGTTGYAAQQKKDEKTTKIINENEKLKQQIANLQSVQTTPGSLLVKAPAKPKKAVTPTTSTTTAEPDFEKMTVAQIDEWLSKNK